MIRPVKSSLVKNEVGTITSLVKAKKPVVCDHSRGEVYFSSFVPGSDGSVNQCLSSGKGYLYKKNLHRGTRGYKTDYLYAGELVLDTPQLVIPPAEQPKDPNAKVPTPDMF